MENKVIAKEYVDKNYVNKDKAKEVLEDIYDYFYIANAPDEDLEFIDEKIKELLEGK